MMATSLFQGVKRYWEGLSDRDQKALTVLGAALLIFLAWAVVWRPAAEYAAASRTAAEQARADYIWMKEREGWVRQLARQPAGQTGNLLSRVNSQARRHGIELKRFEPRGDNRLNVWLEAIAFDKVVLWLADLTQAGVDVRQITVDQAGQPGQVNVRLSLEG
ncbi:MAG: type II secretion system protein M [Gammaproteobacteria bacterium]|nr:MAG: type II secretion system protein M [Gammaproteobacteria bacterium]